MGRFRRSHLSLALVGVLLSVGVGPALAQMDLSGDWRNAGQQDALDNPHLGEFGGLPLTEEAIRRAEIWDASIQSLPEWQCRPHSMAYISRGPSNLRIWKEVDPASRDIVAWQTEWLRSVNTPIYMDNRPHPPAHAPHTWGGFSTGVWEGERLKVTTTHLKEDYYRRNGVPHSDKIRLTQYLIRRRFQNEDYLSWVTVAHDEVYLTEPLIRSTEYRQDLNQRIPPYPCTVVEEVTRADGVVPHHFPGENKQFFDFFDTYGLPRELVNDGARTIYPEYRLRLHRSGVVGPRVRSTAMRSGDD